MTTSPRPTDATRLWLWLGLLWGIIFTIRLLGPPNILDQRQQRPASYVLDVVQNGNWLCQRDYVNDITSKPPLWTWLAAVVTLICGRINLFAIYLPGAVAMAGTMALLFVAGKKYFSLRAGLFAALAIILCSAGSKWMGLARTDGVFTFTITATAFLAWRAWNQGGGWTWFWLMAAVATLAKGPLGVVLAATGLFAALWERKSADRLPLKGSHWLGIILFFLIAGGWFALAYNKEGTDLINKMLGKELVGHIAHDAKGRLPGRLLWQPPLFYLSNAAPWSFLAFFSLWRIWKYPAPNPNERRFERFLFCWFTIDLVLFSLSPHQRADLLWPLMPPGALLAGREVSRLLNRFPPLRIRLATTAAVIVAIGGIYFFYFNLRAREPLVQQTVALKRLAGDWERATQGRIPLVNVDAPMAFQFYLNTVHLPLTPERAADILRSSQPAFLAVKDSAALNAARHADDRPFFTLLPEISRSEHCPIRIISNQPDFVVTNGFVFTSESVK